MILGVSSWLEAGVSTAATLGGVAELVPHRVIRIVGSVQVSRALVGVTAKRRLGIDTRLRGWVFVPLVNGRASP